MRTGRKMTMRATVVRKVDQGPDDYGNPILKDETIGVRVPCYFWYQTGRTERTRHLDNMELVVNAVHGLFRTDADVERGDICTVEDRRGRELFSGIEIDELIPRIRYKLGVSKRYG